MGQLSLHAFGSETSPFPTETQHTYCNRDPDCFGEHLSVISFLIIHPHFLFNDNVVQYFVLLADPFPMHVVLYQAA